MDDREGGLSRRDFLRGTAVAAGAVGAAAAASVSGCAAMPRVIGEGKGTHPCDHRFCRYYRAPATGAGWGRCALVLRERGGEP